MDKKEAVYSKHLRGIIFWGRLILLLALFGTFLPVLHLWVFHGVVPDSSVLWQAATMIGSIMIVSWLVEPLAYFPILGISGTYMSWLAGNISNMRVPVSAVAQQSAGAEEGSPEGDIASTLGIGTSVLINLAVIMLAVVFGAQIIGVLPETVRTAFDFILPAVFGAVLASFAMRNLRLGLIALAIAFALTTLNAPIWITLPGCVFGTIAIGVLMHKSKAKKDALAAASDSLEEEEKNEE